MTEIDATVISYCTAMKYAAHILNTRRAYVLPTNCKAELSAAMKG